jgi:hypothetical protein
MLFLLALTLFAGRAGAAPVKDGKEPDRKERGEFPEIESDALLLAHVRVGNLWSSPLVQDILARAAKVEGGKELLRDLEKRVRKELGFWPGDIDAVTFCFPESPTARHEDSRFIAIVTAAKPFDREQVLKEMRRDGEAPEGFIRLDDNLLLHFLDNRTAVVVHDGLVERYLAGYAKSRSDWPMSKALKKAAATHDLIAVCNPVHVPEKLRREFKEVTALLNAKSLVLVGDLHGKEVRATLRVCFQDESAAKSAKAEGVKLIAAGVEVIGEEMEFPSTKADWGAAIVLLKELQRAVKDIKLDRFGADLQARGVGAVDFPVEKFVAETVFNRRMHAERGWSKNNLKFLGLGLQGYADANDGALIVHATNADNAPIKDLKEKRLLSWRVAILPYIEQGALYNQFKLDEPWDSENNKQLIAKMPKIYAPAPHVKAPEGHTFYQMVIGPAAMRPGLTFSKLLNLDGTADTISVVEAAEPVIWTKPGDVMIPGKEMPKDLKKKFGGLCPGGFHVLMWDGSVRWVDPRRVSEKTLWNAIRPDDGEPLGKDW